EAVEGSGRSVSIHSLRLPLLSLSLSPEKAISRAVKQLRLPHRSTVQSKALPPHRISTSQNFQYGSYPSSQNFGGGSEIPPFSSQQPDAPASREDPPVASRERRQWTLADDEVVISVWLNTSKDVVVGNEQKSGTFCKRVAEYYASTPHAKESGEPREWFHLKQRWQKINDYTNKLCGAYAAAERQISSGQSDTDVLKVAHDIYFADHKRKFNLEHVWCVLRFEQKWLSLNTPKPTGSSKLNTGEECSQTLSTTVGDQEVRPEGSKAAKA
ncbi:hypothetical protein F2Q69_00034219, partial [Brassica cretica]